jgi:dCTP deaminase
MGVKPDQWIRRMALEHRMIEPFSERVDGPGVVSYGLEPAGYTARLHPDIRVVNDVSVCGQALDPLAREQNEQFYRTPFLDPMKPYFDISPWSCVIARTVERFTIPRTIVVRGTAKTSYSTLGLNLDVASIQPEWEGQLKLHLANPSRAAVRVHFNMGLIYLEFHEVDGEVERSYAELAHPRFQDRRP